MSQNSVVTGLNALTTSVQNAQQTLEQEIAKVDTHNTNAGAHPALRPLAGKGIAVNGWTISNAIKTGQGLDFDAAGNLVFKPADMDTATFDALIKKIRVPEWLTANRSWYVRTDGNDNNDGSANTAAKAFKTIQKALNHISENYNLGPYNATIQVAAGAYPGNITIPKCNSSTGALSIMGESKETTFIQGTFSSTPSAGTISISRLSLKNTGATSSGSSGETILRSAQGVVFQVTECDFLMTRSLTTATSTTVLYADKGIVVCNENCTMTLSAAAKVYAVFLLYGGSLSLRRSITANGEITTAFLKMQAASSFLRGSPAEEFPVISGTVTGGTYAKRYDIASNSICDTKGAGANFFPGVAAGTTTTGGQYF